MKLKTEQQIQTLKDVAMLKLNDLQTNWQSKIRALTQTTSTELSSLHQIGIDAGTGLLNGLASMEEPLISKAQEIANAISATIQSALAIHSPSRVMKGFGINIGEGLIVGMDDMISKVAASSKRLSDAVVSAQSSLNNNALKSQNQASVMSSSSVNNSRTFAPVIHNYNSTSDKGGQERMLRRLAFQFN